MNKSDESQSLNDSQSPATVENTKVVKKLILIVFGMFGFGFALVPLYDVFCDITGLNGKTSTEAATYNVEQVDTQRIVTVQFISRTAQGIPWKFEPMTNEIKVHPGEMKLVKFYAKNESTRDIIGQAVPSVSPGLAAAYFQGRAASQRPHSPGYPIATMLPLVAGRPALCSPAAEFHDLSGVNRGWVAQAHQTALSRSTAGQYQNTSCQVWIFRVHR